MHGLFPFASYGATPKHPASGPEARCDFPAPTERTTHTPWREFERFGKEAHDQQSKQAYDACFVRFVGLLSSTKTAMQGFRERLERRQRKKRRKTPNKKHSVSARMEREWLEKDGIV